MKTAVFLTNDNGNPGDSFVSLGCKWLLFDAFGWYHGIDLPTRMGTDLSHVVVPAADFAITVGSPWLWDGCCATQKYATLKAFNEKVSTAKVKIAWGVGASFVHSVSPDAALALFSPDELRSYWGGYDLIVCRDQIAFDLFDKLGLPCALAPCPSFYAAKNLRNTCKKTGDHLLVYTAVTNPQSVPTHVYADTEKVQEYQERQHGMVTSGVPVMTMTQPDYDSFVAAYQRPPTFHALTPAAIVAVMETFSSVTTGRVHAAVIARALDIDTMLFSVDSRAATAYHLGAWAYVNTPKEWAKIGWLIDYRSKLLELYGKNTDSGKHA